MANKLLQLLTGHLHTLTDSSSEITHIQNIIFTLMVQ